MPRVTVRDVGRFGVILDRPPHELPPEAWSRVSNVSFYDMKAVRALGEYDVFGTPTVTPIYLAPSPSSETAFWVYTNLLKVFCVAGTVHTDITRVSGNYSGSIDHRWNGGWLNGVLILNNGVDDPQQWAPISAGTKLVALSNWPANTKAEVIRPFQEFLMALNVTKVSVNYPTMVKWSHPADPGSVPPTWDESDATKLAGERSLSSTPGAVVDGLTLGQSFIVYKQDAVFRFDRIQTNDIFASRPISSSTGLMAQQCVVEFQPNKHIFLSLSGDVLVTDGLQITSVIDSINRRALENRMDGQFRSRSLLAVNYKAKEVYVAYPTIGSEYCNQAAVWNWVDSTWSFKDISPTLDIKAGIFSESSVNETWNSDSQVWNADPTPWNQRLSVGSEYKLIGAFPQENRLRQVGRGQKLGSVTVYSTSLERQGLSLVGQARDGTPRNDPNVVKLVTEVYPLMTAPTQMTLNVYVGSQDFPLGPITWAGPYPFDPTTMEKVDCYMEGRYIAVRFESPDEIEWGLVGYGLKMDLVGEYM